MDEQRTVVFITHAEVVIDPGLAVTAWPLSPSGRARHEAFNDDPLVAGISAVYSSAERKARDGAEILAAAVGVRPTVTEALHENDRSATGYLPRAEFEAVADAFFARPAESVRGWERAVDAQARIVAAVEAIVAADRTAGAIAIVAHGGVGALLLAHLTDAPISRALDQPGESGGNLFVFRRPGGVVEAWRPIA